MHIAEFSLVSGHTPKCLTNTVNCRSQRPSTTHHLCLVPPDWCRWCSWAGGTLSADRSCTSASHSGCLRPLAVRCRGMVLSQSPGPVGCCLLFALEKVIHHILIPSSRWPLCEGGTGQWNEVGSEATEPPVRQLYAQHMHAHMYVRTYLQIKLEIAFLGMIYT